jgi:hypothetical protein
VINGHDGMKNIPRVDTKSQNPLPNKYMRAKRDFRLEITSNSRHEGNPPIILGQVQIKKGCDYLVSEKLPEYRGMITIRWYDDHIRADIWIPGDLFY